MRTLSAVIILLVFICAALPGGAFASPPNDPFAFKAASYLVRSNGEVVWARNPDRRLPPASLTKIMTARLALKKGALEELVTVSKAASRETGSRLGLNAGEQMYLGFLVSAALLKSANDACHAIADHVGGSEAAFVAMMNREAASLGLKDTRFRNACGHDEAGHYSTARDLSVLAEAALKDRAFADIVSLVALDITTAGGKRKFRVENTNELMGRYPGAIGVKSGFTSKAGKCVVALAERDGKRLMLVMLNAPNRWWSAVEALDAGFSTVKKASR
ncbi:MAG: D-alanyl-D-alanine carboxypeptidase [Deltaproteobacteria bacterium]|nr:D-alanyl-D-alanine carboxypeptidase [Deltaproteobacteria bacterium]